MKRLACLYALGLCLTGCASKPPVRPTGFLETLRTQKLNELRSVCMDLKLGSQLNIELYTRGEDAAETGMSGYFYAYNKMSETLFISRKPITFFDRGQPFELTSIASITVLLPSVKAAFPVVEIPEDLKNTAQFAMLP